MATAKQITEHTRLMTTGAEQWSAATFPQDLGIHYMSFVFSEMKYGDGNDQPFKKIGGCILLPVPTNLIDALNMQYNDIELGLVGGIVANEVAGAKGKVAAAVKEIETILKGTPGAAAKDIWAGGAKMLSNAADLARSELAKGGEVASGAFREGTDPLAIGLNRLFGNAPNPNLITMFRGVGLRSHSFEWKLAPRNQEESKQLSRIIKIFKNAALPGTKAGGKLLTFPHQVQIAIAGTSTSEDDTSITTKTKSYYNTLIRFKPVVIKSITANYAPDNTPSFFAGTGHPTATSLRLEFQETQIHTRDDYEQEGLYQTEQEIENRKRGPSSRLV